MKTMKNISLLLMGVLMMGTVSAQKRAKLSDEEKSAKHVERLSQKLELDDAQVKKLEAISESHMDDTKALRDEMKAEKEKMKGLRKEMKAKRESHKKEIKAILTAEQLKKFEEMEQEREAHKSKRKADKEHCKKMCKGEHEKKQDDLKD